MHRVCYSRKGMPVLPIGPVNLLTGEQTHEGRMFDSVWDCWEENPQHHNMLLVNSHSGKLYIVHTAGEGYPPGDTMDLVHDQTNRWIGRGKWEVLACLPHTPEGLASLAQIAKAKKLIMATFK